MHWTPEDQARRLRLIEQILARVPAEIAELLGPALIAGRGANMGLGRPDPELDRLFRELNAIPPSMFGEDEG
jgi:hypothetical protein